LLSAIVPEQPADLTRVRLKVTRCPPLPELTAVPATRTLVAACVLVNALAASADAAVPVTVAVPAADWLGAGAPDGPADDDEAAADPVPAGLAATEVPATEVDALAAGAALPLTEEPHAVRLARATTPAAASAAGTARPAGNLTGNMRPPPDISPHCYPLPTDRN
jgi:hypothetical protein